MSEYGPRPEDMMFRITPEQAQQQRLDRQEQERSLAAQEAQKKEREKKEALANIPYIFDFPELYSIARELEKLKEFFGPDYVVFYSKPQTIKGKLFAKIPGIKSTVDRNVYTVGTLQKFFNAAITRANEFGQNSTEAPPSREQLESFYKSRGFTSTKISKESKRSMREAAVEGTLRQIGKYPR